MKPISPIATFLLAISIALASIDWANSCTLNAIDETWPQIRALTNPLLPFSFVLIGFDKYKELKKLLGGYKLPREPTLQIKLGLLNIFGKDKLEFMIGPIIKFYLWKHPCPSEPSTPEPTPMPTEGPEVSESLPYCDEPSVEPTPESSTPYCDKTMSVD